jgi:ribosome modulation factor
MNDLASASDSPLIQGRNARVYGKGRDTCPYGEDTEEGRAWMEAFEGRDTLTTAPDPEADRPSPPAQTVPGETG